jgi:putative addiction module component (TIGR02574 family)
MEFTMSTDNEVFTAALSLPLNARAQLAQQLIESLEVEPADPDADEAWAREIEDRISAYERGEIKARPWKEAIAEIRESLGKDRSP